MIYYVNLENENSDIIQRVINKLNRNKYKAMDAYTDYFDDISWIEINTKNTSYETYFEVMSPKSSPFMNAMEFLLYKRPKLNNLIKTILNNDTK